MIKSLTVTNHLGESITFELGDPEKSGLLIQSIEGLGPSKATINSKELATMDGSLFVSARANNRNIVITFAMLFCPTVEDSRQKTYKYFPVKKRIKLEFETDNRSVYTYGNVESNDPNIFSSQETTQISIICEDPYFYASDGLATAFSGAQPMFEFPFSNESLTENMIETAQIRIDSRAIINYPGDADTGAIITIHGTGPATNIALFNTMTHETMAIDTTKLAALTGGAFGSGDDIIISTIKGNKYIYLLRNGVYTNIVNALGKNASWFQLSSGDNIFAYSADTGEKNLIITFSYRNAYGGV